MESREERYKNFLNKHILEEDSSKTLEKALVDFCEKVMENHEDYEMWEYERDFNAFNVLCRNLAIKHLEEKGFDIMNCVDMFGGIGGNYYNSLFEYNEEEENYKYIGK